MGTRTTGRKPADQASATVNELLPTKGAMLRAGTVVGSTLISVPSSSESASGQCGPEMRRGKRAALDKTRRVDALIDKVEKVGGGIEAKAEHPFRVIERKSGFVKGRHRGLAKDAVHMS